MSTQPIAPHGRQLEALRDDSVTYGAVHLSVIDMGRSLAFWRDLIGLGEIDSSAQEARLGVDGRALVVLHAGAQHPVGRGHAGLYHLALHVPNDIEFARTLVRLGQAGVSQSPTDHILSKATYLHDPNGILLEIALETPQRCRSVEIGSHGVVMIDSDGHQRAGTEPLDFSAAVAPLAGGDPWLPLARDSYVGHVHLHVPDLAAAHDFYRDVIGFQEHAYMTPIGMADLSAGGRFGHRMAVNNWHGPGAAQPPVGTAGMLFYELLLRDAGELDPLVRRAANAGIDVTDIEEQADAGSGIVSLLDPAGNRLTVGELGR